MSAPDTIAKLQHQDDEAALVREAIDVLSKLTGPGAKLALEHIRHRYPNAARAA